MCELGIAAIVGGGRTGEECEEAWVRSRDRYTQNGSWVGYTPSAGASGPAGQPPPDPSEYHEVLTVAEDIRRELDHIVMAGT